MFLSNHLAHPFEKADPRVLSPHQLGNHSSINPDFAHSSSNGTSLLPFASHSPPSSPCIGFSAVESASVCGAVVVGHAEKVEGRRAAKKNAALASERTLEKWSRFYF
jgi:hypothetical protein